MDPIGLLRALMFGEDDLLRINLDKDDMMMMMIHNLHNSITFDFNWVVVYKLINEELPVLLTSLSMISFQDQQDLVG